MLNPFRCDAADLASAPPQSGLASHFGSFCARDIQNICSNLARELRQVLFFMIGQAGLWIAASRSRSHATYINHLPDVAYTQVGAKRGLHAPIVLAHHVGIAHLFPRHSCVCVRSQSSRCERLFGRLNAPLWRAVMAAFAFAVSASLSSSAIGTLFGIVASAKYW